MLWPNVAASNPPQGKDRLDYSTEPTFRPHLAFFWGLHNSFFLAANI